MPGKQIRSGNDNISMKSSIFFPESSSITTRYYKLIKIKNPSRNWREGLVI
jgi:hypothetical protein